MLFGLYLITPVLRVLTVNSSRRLLKYFLVLLVFGTAVVPLLALVSGFNVETKLFAVTGWISYFLLGYYLLESKVRTSRLAVSWLTGFLTTIVGTYAATALISGHTGLYFLDYLTATVFLASTSLFMLLGKVSPTILASRFPRFSRFIQFIGCSTLAIYLLHVMVLEALQKGFFGFHLSLNTLHPIVEIPLITTVALLISLGIVFVLGKIPVVKKLTGLQ
jgi:surface polysaccharide O-acyltransferase-like enzyme